MAYGLELQFDAATDAAVRGVWRALEAAGMPTPAGAPGRPHLSLARCDVQAPVRFAAALARFAAGVAPFDVEFGNLGVFVPEGWVFLAPLPAPELLGLHVRMHRWLAGQARGVGAVHVDPYVPGRWVPHCTLTQRLAPGLVARTMELCLRIGLPAGGRVERLGLTHYPPVEELRSLVLGTRASAVDIVVESNR